MRDCNTFWNFVVEKKDKAAFNSLYPECASRFFRQCTKKAVENRDFFNYVFFGIKNENTLRNN